MTHQFLMRAAAASVPLAIGLALMWGKPAIYDKLIAAYSVFEVLVVFTCISALFGFIAIWVCAALRLNRWPSGSNHSVTRSTAIIAVIAAACVSAQRAEALVVLAAQSEVQTVDIQQPFTLPQEIQRQVDAAIEQAGKEARDHPGFIITVEMAIGIFIAAVILGTILVIIVRAVCKSLDRIRDDIRTRMGKVKEFLENPTNPPPVLIGAGLFNDRPAGTDDLPVGLEFNLSFVAPEPLDPAALTGAAPVGETVSLNDLLAGFGVPDKWPSESVTGQSVSRTGTGYTACPSSYTNLVKLAFESTTNLTKSAWTRVLNLTVPAGALIDFADLTGESEGRYWRIISSPAK